MDQGSSRFDRSRNREWVNVGNTFAAVVDGRILALLYWSEATPAEEGGAGGEPVVADAGWFLVFADEPFEHTQIPLELPTLWPGMPYKQLAEAWEQAREKAAEMIESHIAPDDQTLGSAKET
jgi:hypothetical protein